MKLFGIGLSRTGTKSLAGALETLGYRTGHYAAGMRAFFERQEAPRLDSDLLREWDALTDIPLVPFYQELDRQYPGSKFILTLREREAWLRSCERHYSNSRSSCLEKTDIDFEQVLQLRRIIYGIEHFDREQFSKVYDAHIAEVLRYFEGREQDLLQLDICSGEGWAELCAFLCAPIPEQPFPKVNTAAAAQLELINAPQAPAPSGALLCFGRFRNERLRLPWFLEFHRRIGVDHFVVVDNDSSDGSGSYLASQPDVTLYRTGSSFAANNSGMDWLNPLLDRHGGGRWCLTLDADELFIFPGCEQVGIKRLAAILDIAGADALYAGMIDMYSAGAIRETRYRPGQDFLSVCPYFDHDSLSDERRSTRSRLFWSEKEGAAAPPFLGKIPLVRWRPGRWYRISTHVIDGVTLSDIRGAILHFKLFGDFRQKVAAGVEEQQYWQSSAQYRRYLSGLEQQPNLRAHYSGSLRFESSQQLVELGLMRSTPALDSCRKESFPPRTPPLPAHRR